MALSNAAKVVLGSATVMLVVLLAIVVAGARWVLANKDRVGTSARNAGDEGERFGGTHSQAECSDETIRRSDECTDGIMCPSLATLFLSRCLAMKDRDDALCAGVPAPAPFNTWAQDRCIAQGHRNQSCFLTLRTVQQYCRR